MGLPYRGGAACTGLDLGIALHMRAIEVGKAATGIDIPPRRGPFQRAMAEHARHPAPHPVRARIVHARIGQFTIRDHAAAPAYAQAEVTGQARGEFHAPHHIGDGETQRRRPHIGREPVIDVVQAQPHALRIVMMVCPRQGSIDGIGAELMG